MSKENQQDPWKKLIDENKEAFNQRKPKDLWSSIEQEIQPQKVKTIELWKVYRAAAILIIVVGLGFFALTSDFSEKSTPQTTDMQTETEAELNHLTKELIEVENFYVVEIDEKLEEVKQLSEDNIAIEEIQELKKEFDELKLEMGDNINDERIVEALIKNYRLRLELLKEILNELKSDDPSFKNEKDETELI